MRLSEAQELWEKFQAADGAAADGKGDILTTSTEVGSHPFRLLKETTWAEVCHVCAL